jgi:hypothetical protein
MTAEMRSELEWLRRVKVDAAQSRVQWLADLATDLINDLVKWCAEERPLKLKTKGKDEVK